MPQVMESKARPVLHKLSLAERSDPKVLSVHKALSVKSRVRGDFHARFCERVRVKLPRSTRPMIPSRGACAFRDKRVILIILNNFVP